MADDGLTPLLSANESWSSSIKSSSPSFFAESSKGQSPHTLWLGCSDSRVPETTLLSASPGDVFAHRNIANIVHSSDLSLLSVIEFAVTALKVSQIVICGHTSCGGCAAAMGNSSVGGKLDAWLVPLRELRWELKGELGGLGEQEGKDRLAEENVRRGVRVVRENPDVVREGRERGLRVYGAMYDLKEGRLRRVDVGEESGEREGVFGL